MNIADGENSGLILLFIVIAVLLLSLLIIILSFFMVRVKGAIEESDEVYELICITFLRFNKGRWQVELGKTFNEYAAVKLLFGWTFLKLFEDSSIDGISYADKKGIVISTVKKETILLRRRVRSKD